MKTCMYAGSCALFLALGLAMSLASAQAAAAAKVDPYPLDTCIVSGQKLGAMGDAVRTEYKDREIKFCCAGCKPKFEAKPDEYLKKIDEEIVKQQKPKYPLDTCVVTGEKLGPDAYDYVSHNRLVRFCCKACVAQFEKDPQKYFAKIDEAAKAKPKS